MNLEVKKLAGIAGLVFVVLNVAAGLALAPQPPLASDSVHKIVSYYADHRTALLLQGYVFGLSWVAYLIFLGGLWGRIRTSLTWAPVAVAGGAVWLALQVVSQATISSLADRIAGHYPAASTMVGLHDHVIMLFGFSFFPLIALLVGGSLASKLAGVLGTIGSLFGLIVAAVALIAGLLLVWPSSQGLAILEVLDYLAFLIWSAWISVALIRRPEAALP